jgi:hypothetical protein
VRAHRNSACGNNITQKHYTEIKKRDNVSLIVSPRRAAFPKRADECRRETQMKSHEPKRDEERGRVVSFRPRVPRARNDNQRWPRPLRSPVGDLSKYERDREADSYRHRMVNNLLAFAVLCMIVTCGIWLTNTVAEMRAGLDCSLTGRTNCAPIRLPPAEPR